MILEIHQLVRSRMAEAVGQLYGMTATDPVIADMALEAPPRRALGDVAVPVAFALARRLKKAPRVIAQELAAALGTIEGIARIEAAPNGYLNFFLDRPLWLRRWSGDTDRATGSEHADGKTIVEHTAINPNKAAHIGHLRNAALGDAFGRLLRFQGRQVEIQNYIDDTGVQVADVVVGFRELEHRGLEDVRALAASARFDYYCWDLYAKVTEWYEQDKSRLKLRTDALHAVERGGNEIAEMGALIADRIVRAHLDTMRRMNIGYDLLTWEGDILRLHFWAHAFEFLKKIGAVFLQTEGKLAGCWVMRIEDEPGDAPASDDAQPTDGRGAGGTARKSHRPLRRHRHVRRQGHGVPALEVRAARAGLSLSCLRPVRRRPAHSGQRHRSPSRTRSTCPSSVTRTMVCNVIDTRQSYLQKLVKQALAVLGFAEQARQSIHYSYEMVALSPETARELGYAASDESGKPFVEVSGRKGLGVKADDLLDRLTEKAASEVARQKPRVRARRCPENRGGDRDGGGALLHGEVLARKGHRVRHRRSAQFRGGERTRTCSTPLFAPTTSSAS